MKKIKLYTCHTGATLFKNGLLFTSWKKDLSSEGDIAFLINPQHVIFNRDGCADILKLDSIEIA